MGLLLTFKIIKYFEIFSALISNKYNTLINKIQLFF